nr:MAG TPA: helix-turn-helix domain protein [Caudoviricetes sp.]
MNITLEEFLTPEALPTMGKRIRALRRYAGMTQRALAVTINTSVSTVASYENDRHTPRVDIVYRLADALGTSFAFLVCLTDNPSPDTNYIKE